MQLGLRGGWSEVGVSGEEREGRKEGGWSRGGRVDEWLQPRGEWVSGLQRSPEWLYGLSGRFFLWERGASRR